MYKIQDIKSIHIEASSFCNAACPVCNRNIFGGPTADWFPQKEIKLKDMQKFLSEEVIKNLDSLLFCGNYGDPAMASELVEICTWLKSVNPNLSLSINTNAGIRNSDFWSKLGKVLNGNSFVTFSVDGLEDTNHIYRRNVRWENVEMAMKSFIAAGGTANWEFLVFKHNQHQLEEAREMAKEMGFKHFFAKKAFGFFHNGGRQRISVYKKTGEFDYYIYPPDEKFVNSQYLNSEQREDEESLPSLGPLNNFYQNNREIDVAKMKIDEGYEKKLNSCQISCYSLNRNEIYISVEGLVFPCCFTASKYYGMNKDDFINRQFQSFIDRHGKESHSLYHHELSQILEGDLFQNQFPKAWNSPGIRNGKLAVCADFCGNHNVGLKEVIDSKTAKES